ncbi:MAG: glycosyltransferase family 2 protein [Chitinophagales bacterium]
MTPLSVVIITFNEDKNIANCLESVKGVADEIVVVDSFSTDQTKSICGCYPVRFIEHAFEGHIEQKNFALTQATHPHVLSLDADECLSQELQQSILSVKQNWQQDGYYLNRLSNFCGSWIHHSGWYPDRKMRLFNKNKGQWGGTNPHDKFELATRATEGRITGDLLHYTARSEQEYRKKMEGYATIAAAEMYGQHKSAGSLIVYLKVIASFFRNYFFRFGFLDGRMGLKVCSINAGYTFQKYNKLRNLNKTNPI